MSDLNLPTIIHERIDQQTKRLALGGVAVATLLSLAALILTFRQPAPPVFISVSMKSLVEDHMLATMGREITAHEAELRTREFSRALDLALAEVSGEEGVMVLAAEAVVGANVPDFTEDIRLRTRAIAAEFASRRGQTLPPPGDRTGMERIIGQLQNETESLAAQLDPPLLPEEGRP